MTSQPDQILAQTLEDGFSLPATERDWRSPGKPVRRRRKEGAEVFVLDLAVALLSEDRFPEVLNV